MSTDKASTERATEEPIKVIVEQTEDATKNRSAKVEVLSLSIDEDFDLGSDPYNRTGQFVALELREDEFE